MKILFSPIGGTDPITNQNDGAMLHICRVYQPDVVYLYLSHEMAVYQRQDQRYTKVLEWLGERIQKNIQVHLLEDSEMKDVHIFDVFIEPFEKYIYEIDKEYGQGNEVFLNVSSGTPAMKSSLQLLAFMHPKLKAVQVSTPVKGLNKIHEDKDSYDVETQWEWNEDNAADYINRCNISGAAKLMDRLKKESIRNFINKYDYTAVEMLVEELAVKPDNDFIDLLHLAIQRNGMNIKECQAHFKQFSEKIFPVRAEEYIAQFEYLLNLMLKLKKREYADFVRGITPLATELMVSVMEKKCHIRLRDIAKKNKRGVYKITPELVSKYPDIYHAFEREFGSVNYGVISSIHCKIIICEKASDEKLKTLVGNIRSVEEEVRNLAAHQIVSIDEKFVKKKTGFTMEKIVDMLQRLLQYSGANIKKEDWQAYEYMNEELCKLLYTERLQFSLRIG